MNAKTVGLTLRVRHTLERFQIQIMLDKRNKIDFAAVDRNLPKLVEGFGRTALSRQVVAHNELVDEGYSENTSPVHFASLLRRFKGVKSPHMALLNMLSAWNSPLYDNPVGYRWVARLFLLEKLLDRAVRAGERPTGYQDMLRDPAAIDRLIAELSVASPFTMCGRFVAHQLTSEIGASRKNYDISWTGLGCRLRADVKWFDTWVTKRSGSDPLDGLLCLLRPDITRMVYVSLERGPYSDEMILEAADEVLALYDAAVSGNGGPQVQVSVTGTQISAMRPRRSYPQASVVARVKEVTLWREDKPAVAGASDSPFVVSEVGSASDDEDVNSVRRCLQDGATQVPASLGPRALSCIAIGSSNFHDEENVSTALFGGEEIDPATSKLVHVPGLFSPETGETSLHHIDGVCFFSLSYESTRGRAVRVRRHARVFRRSDGLSSFQRGALWLWGVVARRSSNVTIPKVSA